MDNLSLLNFTKWIIALFSCLSMDWHLTNLVEWVYLKRLLPFESSGICEKISWSTLWSVLKIKKNWPTSWTLSVLLNTLCSANIGTRLQARYLEFFPKMHKGSTLTNMFDYHFFFQENKTDFKVTLKTKRNNWDSFSKCHYINYFLPA